MAIKTGKFIDTRDGHVYHTVLMPDGKWWSAENLAWDGAGMDWGDNPANRKLHGRLYTPSDAAIACPPGASLLTEEIWDNFDTLCDITAHPEKIRNLDSWPVGTLCEDTYGLSIVTSGMFYGGGFSDINYSAWIFISENKNLWVHWENLPVEKINSFPTFAYSIRFIIDSGNIPDFLPEDHLPEQITLEPISIHSQFKAYSGTVRTLNGSGGTYFVANSTYKLELTSEEYAAFDEWWENSIHFGEIPFQIPNFPLGKIGMAVQLIALPSVTQTHSGYSVSLKAQFKSSDTIGGIYNTTCPFKLSELSGNQFQVSQTFIVTGGVSTARTPLNRRGIQMSLGFIGNADELAQLIEWFRFGIGNGSKMFKASTDSKINWLWKLTSVPKFTMKGALGSAIFEVLGRAP